MLTDGDTRRVWSLVEVDRPAHSNWFVYDAEGEAEAHRERAARRGIACAVEEITEVYREAPSPHWETRRPR
jgi:hypothetical protein